MAQKILLRRGPVGNLASVSTSQGELLLVTGSVNDLAGPFITMTGTAGTGTSTIVGKIYEGSTAPSIASNSTLTGTPFYATGNNTLYRLNHAGNEILDLSGNLEGNTVSAMTVTTLTGTTINISGDITGSNMLLSGNANIDGNIVLGGNITIGDQTTDNIQVGGEFTSNLVPDVDSTYDLGTNAKRWANIYVDNVSGSTADLQGAVTIGGATDIGGALTVAGAATVSGSVILGDTNGDTVTFVADVASNIVPATSDLTIGTSGDKWLHGYFASASIDNLAIGGIDPTAQDLDDVMNNGSSTDNDFTLSKAGDQSITHTGATGNLLISSTNGNVVVEGTTFSGNDVTIAGDLTVNGTTTTVNSSEVNIGDRLITLNTVADAADGGIQVIDTSGSAHTGSLLWNAANDYWYAGISGSTHYRLVEYGNGTPSSGTVLKTDANGHAVATNITDNGSLVDVAVALTVTGSVGVLGNTTLNGNLEVTGATTTNTLIDSSSSTAIRFSYINASKQFAYITPTTAGDLIQWNGTAMEASNIIDGGSF